MAKLSKGAKIAIGIGVPVVVILLIVATTLSWKAVRSGRLKI